MAVALKACVFDVYGTLFDVHSPMKAMAPELGPKAAEISALWRSKQLEYTWLRSLMQHYVDFTQVTADALDFTLSAHGIANPTLRDKLLNLYMTLAPFDDAAPCLESLRAAKAKTGILSNGSPKMLAAAVTAAQFGQMFDYVLSVDTAQIYKPSPPVYQLAVSAFGVRTDEIGFISANGWDCCGAAAFGFHVIHVNRFGQPKERLGVEPNTVAADLHEAASLLLQRI